MAQAPSRPRHRNDFKIAVICALPGEAEMVELVFDKFWDDHGERYGKALGDQNTYTTGVIGFHNVVLTYMPAIGSNNAAVVAAGLRSSFRGIEITFVVGICGVVPYHSSTKDEIILGDCIISTAVVQYDFGRQYPDGFIRKSSVEDSLGRANLEVRALTTKLMTRRNRRQLTERLAYHLDVLQNLETDVTYPGAGRDRLFEPSHNHEHRGEITSCNMCLIGSTICLGDCDSINCGDINLVIRRRLSKDPGSITNKFTTSDGDVLPMMHFGRFGSANTVMRSGLDRDLLAQDGGLIAFEMEGSGVWDTFPTIVVKSACDYADSHKSKEWHVYAAATAAAGLKAVLEKWETSEDTFQNALLGQDLGNRNHETKAAFSDANYEQSLSIDAREQRGQESIEHVRETLKILLENASCFEEECKYETAELHYYRAFTLSDGGLGPEHLDTLCVMDKLGQICSKQLMYEKAEVWYVRALQAKEQTVGQMHESTLATVHNLGALLRNLDQFEEAEKMSLRALRGREQILGSLNVSTLTTVEALGILYRYLDRFDEAERMFLRALHGKEEMFGPQNIATLDTLSYLGNMYRYLKRYDEAEKICIQVLQGREEALGSQHRSTLQAVYDLGTVYSSQKRFLEAERMLMRALRGRENLFGKQHILTVNTCHRLGASYSRQNKLDIAETTLLRVLEARRAVLGEKHTLVLGVLNTLACVYNQQGRFLEA